MGQLQARTVRRISMPAYPTRLEVLADNHLLQEHLPPGWLARSELAGMLGVFLVANGTIHAADAADQPSGEKRPPPKAAIVAPIFAHGDGRGSSGCVAVVAPVFLSEEDALAVIREELSGSGVEITTTGVEWPAVSIPTRKLAVRQNWVNNTRSLELVEDPANAKPLKVDLQDDKHHIRIEYISPGDHDEFDSSSFYSSVQSYDCKEFAGYVGKHVREQGHGAYFGAFYDPVVRIDWRAMAKDSKQVHDWSGENERAQAEARRLLRLQVKDFTDWLKAQGAI